MPTLNKIHTIFVSTINTLEPVSLGDGEGTYVICREGTIVGQELYDIIQTNISSLLFNPNQTYVFFSTSHSDTDLIVVYNKVDNKLRTLVEMMDNSIVKNNIFGHIDRELSPPEIVSLFFLLGRTKMSLNHFGIPDFDEYFSYINSGNSLGRKFPMKKLFRCCCYNIGYSSPLSLQPPLIEIMTLVGLKKMNVPTERVLVISKKIVGYGGNQKTSVQLISLLEKRYMVDVLSSALTGKRATFNIVKDGLDNTIFKSSIIRLRNNDAILSHVKSNSYKFIVNNKLNEFFNLVPQICAEQHPVYAISHNSMDPFNRLAIDKSESLTKLLTINKPHMELMKNNGIMCPVEQYLNYIDISSCPIAPYRTEFKFAITFVGRLSTEKNVKLLVDTVARMNDNNNNSMNIRLNVVGDCSGELEKSLCFIDHPNIYYYGKLNMDGIYRVLSESDFMVLPSCTEGIPFSVIEAMNIGIPCIYSRIHGSEDIIMDGKSGFLFDLAGYDMSKDVIDSWCVFDNVGMNYDENILRLEKCIRRAYSISINEWNSMSVLCVNTVRKQFSKDISCKHNLNIFDHLR